MLRCRPVDLYGRKWPSFRHPNEYFQAHSKSASPSFDVHVRTAIAPVEMYGFLQLSHANTYNLDPANRSIASILHLNSSGLPSHTQFARIFKSSSVTYPVDKACPRPTRMATANGSIVPLILFTTDNDASRSLPVDTNIVLAGPVHL